MGGVFTPRYKGVFDKAFIHFLWATWVTHYSCTYPVIRCSQPSRTGIYIGIYDKVDGHRTKTLALDEGDDVLFRGLLVHCQAAYNDEHTRVHSFTQYGKGNKLIHVPQNKRCTSGKGEES